MTINGFREAVFALLKAGSVEEAKGWSYCAHTDRVGPPNSGDSYKVSMEATATIEALRDAGYKGNPHQDAAEIMRQGEPDLRLEKKLEDARADAAYLRQWRTQRGKA
jgi:hypothetical protein